TTATMAAVTTVTTANTIMARLKVTRLTSTTASHSNDDRRATRYGKPGSLGGGADSMHWAIPNCSPTTV
ncbi:MAG TPA: hypothetical protein VNW96_21980, partial [Mycobacterium sp.]|nr:hypothetical protein [Mycobacterium sp.]